MSEAAGEPKKEGAGTWLAVGIMALILVALWPYYRPYVARGVLLVTYWECRKVALFHPILPQGYKRQLASIYRGSRALVEREGVEHLKDLTTREFLSAWNVPSKAFIPFMLLLVGFGTWQIKSTDIAQKFRKRYSLEDLIKAQAEFYPHLRPVARVRIDKEPIRSGDWRIKYTDIEFAIKHKLLRDGAGAIVESTSDRLRAAYFDSDRARAVFEKQLGPKWTDKLDDLLPHERAVFGMLAAMVCRERKEALAIAAELSTSWRKVERKGQPHYYSVTTKRGEAAARRLFDTPAIKTIRASHAYVATIMSALAAQKRNSGEFACSHYIWLRPTDPKLFYTLHQEGLPRPNFESAAAFFHYESERRSGMALVVQSVDLAVVGLRSSLISSGYLVPDDEGGASRDWGTNQASSYAIPTRGGLVH